MKKNLALDLENDISFLFLVDGLLVIFLSVRHLSFIRFSETITPVCEKDEDLIERFTRLQNEGLTFEKERLLIKMTETSS